MDNFYPEKKYLFIRQMESWPPHACTTNYNWVMKIFNNYQWNPLWSNVSFVQKFHRSVTAELNLLSYTYLYFILNTFSKHRSKTKSQEHCRLQLTYRTGKSKPRENPNDSQEASHKCIQNAWMDKQTVRFSSTFKYFQLHFNMKHTEWKYHSVIRHHSFIK